MEMGNSSKMKQFKDDILERDINNQSSAFFLVAYDYRVEIESPRYPVPWYQPEGFNYFIIFALLVHSSNI